MRPRLPVLLSVLLVGTALGGLGIATSSTPVAAQAAPTRTLEVGGPGVGMYPAFDPAVERYAATTTEDTGGSLYVEATTSDPAGRIWIDGRLDEDGKAVVTDLAEGDEVSVFFDDSAGRSVHSVTYLPAGFPRLVSTVDEPGNTPGHVLLTLNRFAAGTDNYETAVDRRGVPVYVHANRDGVSQDFKPTGRGGYLVFRDDDRYDDTGAPVVELDAAFEPVRRMRTVGLVHTDGHDSILLPDGSRILAAYETDPTQDNRRDAVIQQVDPDGDVVHQWNSADHFNPVDPDLTGPAREAAMAATDTMNPFVGDTDLTDGEFRADYAHVNSWELVDGGQNLLVSFRNTSSVVKIAWAADRADGHQQGDVIWRLGGKHSDFTFPDDPYAGPCTQHSARQLANGNILIFDNGSPEPGNALFPDEAMCPDPAQPTGDPLGRPQTRVTEYALDEVNGVATLAWEWRDPAHPEWFAYFAGGVERQPNGNTLVNWASTRGAIVSEVEAGTDDVVWELRDAGDHGLSPYFSYRAVKTEVPDAIDPQLHVEAPAAGSQVAQGATLRLDVRCTDRGGSSLVACSASAASGSLDTVDTLDTSVPGTHSVTVTAIDGAGNETVETVDYTVVAAPPAPAPDPPAPTPATPGVSPAPRPDAWVRAPGGSWVGDDEYDVRQRVRVRLGRSTRTVKVRIQDDGTGSELVVRGTRGNRAFKVDYYLGRERVTGLVRRGRLTTGTLAPGERVTLKVKVTRRGVARPGDRRTITVRVRPVGSSDPQDRVQAVLRATR